MGYLASILRPRESRESLANMREPMIRWLSAGRDTVSGIDMDETTAMSYSTVYQCVKVLSETVATLPGNVWERDGNVRRKAIDHRWYKVLRYRPNPEHSPYEFWNFIVACLQLWGNAYAQIYHSNAGELQLWPLYPARMKVTRVRGKVIYEYTVADGTKMMFLPDEILHVRTLILDGLLGVSPIRQNRDAIALGKVAQDYGSRFFANNARPGVLLMHESKWDRKAKESIVESWNNAFTGSGQHKTAFLDEGIKMEQVGIPPGDAQYIELRNFQKPEIAAIFRVPPHKIGWLEKASFSNITEENLRFYTDTILPILSCIESAVERSLFYPQELDRYYFEFLADNILRGDIATRYNAYSVGINNGFLKPNEVREKENLNPEDTGNELFMQGAMAPVRRLLAGDNSDEVDAEGEDMRAVYRAVMLDAANRIVSRECRDIRRLAEKHLERSSSIKDFVSAAEELHDGDWYADTWKQAAFGYAAVLVRGVRRIGALQMISHANAIYEYLPSFSERCANVTKSLLSAVQECDSPEAALALVRERVDAWMQHRPKSLVDSEVTHIERIFGGNYV